MTVVQYNQRHQDKDRRGEYVLPTSQELLHGFEEFWRVYPNRKKKARARSAWIEVNAQRQLRKILDALAWQVRQEQWMKDGGQWIPLPHTWLLDEQWDDEPVELPQMNQKSVRNVHVLKEFLES